MKYLLLLFSGLLSFSCNLREDPNPDALLTINFDQATTKKINTQEISGKLDFTFLQYDEKNPVGVVVNYKISKNYIIVVDIQQKLFVFKKNGDLFSIIFNKGNGPSEYVQIDDFILDDTEENILLLDSRNRKIINFSIEGKFNTSHQMDFSAANRLSKLSNGNYGLYQNAKYSAESENVFILDPDFNLIQTIVDLESNLLNKLPFEFDPIWYQYNHTTFYKEILNDTVFKIGKTNNKEPHFIIDFGSKRMPNEYYADIELIRKHSSQFDQFETDGLRESKNLIFLQTFRNRKLRYFLYLKNAKPPQLLDMGENALSSNFQTDINFWPSYIDDNETMYQFINPSDLTAYLEAAPDKEKIISSNDNPVLMSSKLLD